MERITLSNFSFLVDKTMFSAAVGLFSAGKVLSVTKFDYVPTIGTLYEGRVRAGREIKTLCFCITTDGFVVTDDCFCGAEELCVHYVALLLHINAGLLISLNSLLFLPVQCSDVEDMPATRLPVLMDQYLKRYRHKGKISLWYLPFALEGCIISLLQAKKYSFIDQLNIYSAILLRLDRLSEMYGEIPEVLDACRGRTMRALLETLRTAHSKEPFSRRKAGYAVLSRLEEGLSDMNSSMQILRFMASFCDIGVINAKLREKLNLYMAVDGLEQTDLAQLKTVYCTVLRARSETEAFRYIEENLHEDALRKMAVDMCLENGDTEHAIRYCMDRLRLCRGERELQRCWYRELYRVYEREGSLRKMRSAAKRLLLFGDFDYYARYKALFPAEDWEREQSALFERAENGKHTQNLYLQMIIEEEREDLLFRYCDAHPKAVVGLYPYFRRQNKIKLDKIFEQCVRTIDAENGKNKQTELKYAEIAMKKALGAERAERILKQRLS